MRTLSRRFGNFFLEDRTARVAHEGMLLGTQESMFTNGVRGPSAGCSLVQTILVRSHSFGGDFSNTNMIAYLYRASLTLCHVRSPNNIVRPPVDASVPFL